MFGLFYPNPFHPPGSRLSYCCIKTPTILILKITCRFEITPGYRVIALTFSLILFQLSVNHNRRLFSYNFMHSMSYTVVTLLFANLLVILIVFNFGLLDYRFGFVFFSFGFLTFLFYKLIKTVFLRVLIKVKSTTFIVILVVSIHNFPSRVLLQPSLELTH